jgi:glycosyltransferase involved in cell wall biosynthesis
MPATSLCIVTTHPIQYMAPWFRALSATSGIDLHVVYFREPDPVRQGVGFGTAFKWDMPLREGYSSTVLGAAAGAASVPQAMLGLLRALRHRRPGATLITGWNEPALIAAYPLVRALRIPIIVRCEANGLRKRRSLSRIFHRQLIRMASSAAVIGRSNRQFYLDNGVPANALFDGCYFVESERLLGMASAHEGERDALRAQAGHAREDFVFGFVGKHVPFKRPHLLIEAAALLRARGHSVRLHIAGAGELTASLRKRAEEAGVPAHFTGFLNQSELWKAYVPSDALVLPSDSGETWGLVVNEAMLFGLPVIVSDQVGCGPDLVQDQGTGYIFSGGTEGLAHAMEQMLADRRGAAEMGKRGRALVMDRYSMDRATSGLKAALSFVSGSAAA